VDRCGEKRWSLKEWPADIFTKEERKEARRREKKRLLALRDREERRRSKQVESGKKHHRKPEKWKGKPLREYLPEYVNQYGIHSVPTVAAKEFAKKTRWKWRHIYSTLEPLRRESKLKK